MNESSTKFDSENDLRKSMHAGAQTGRMIKSRLGCGKARLILCVSIDVIGVSTLFLADFMGIQNRDYYRNDNARGGFVGLPGRSACYYLLIANIVCFFLQFLTIQRVVDVQSMIDYAPPDRQQYFLQLQEQGDNRKLEALALRDGFVSEKSILEEWGAVDPQKVEEGQIWRLITYAFLHSRYEFTHLIFNMLALWMFGPAVEELWGKREFLAFYFTAAIVSGLCHVLVGLATRSPHGAVGASGALMAILMVFALYYPHQPICMFMLITLEARWWIVLYLAQDLLPVLKALGGGANRDGVAHAAHLGGLLFGFLYFRYGWKLTNWAGKRGGPSLGRRFVRWWNRPQLRVYSQPNPTDERSPVSREPVRPEPVVRMTSPRDMERRVDEILKKISEQGESSLSDEEREILRAASQAYKRKNT